MPEHGRDNTSETEADRMKEMPREPCAVNGTPDDSGAAAPMATCAVGQAVEPRLVDRDGVAYLDGCDVPVWRLEMARRAGSSPDSQIRLFPSLTRQGLDLAFAYAQEHSAEFDPLIQYHSGASVPPEDEGDDEDDAAFEAELDAMLEEHAEVFRRLAQ